MHKYKEFKFSNFGSDYLLNINNSEFVSHEKGNLIVINNLDNFNAESGFNSNGDSKSHSGIEFAILPDTYDYIKNKDDEANYLYSSKNNSVGKIIPNKSIVVPEYTIKLENLKSRVSNLLNIYSLLALRSLNDTNDKNIDNISNENNKK